MLAPAAQPSLDSPMTNFRTLSDIEVAHRIVLVRGDLNVPMKDGSVSDATRLERLAPTVLELVDRHAKVVILSHFGRPKGEPNPEYSLRPVVPALSKALEGQEVAFAEDCIGPAAEKAVAALRDGEILLLENLRFHAGEEKNDHSFAQALAALGGHRFFAKQQG